MQFSLPSLQDETMCAALPAQWLFTAALSCDTFFSNSRPCLSSMKMFVEDVQYLQRDQRKSDQ